MNYRLIPMTAEHVPQVAALERTCFSHPWTEDMLRQELWNDAAVIVVAEGEDGTVLGYAGLQAVLDEGYINNVAVDPRFRRQGVADEPLLSASVRPSWLFLPWRYGPPTPPPSPSMPSTAFRRRGAGETTMTIPKRMRF